MKNPFFSVIIPTCNRKDFLPITIESVLNQSYTDYELIIVDDGSSDETKAIIKKLYNNNKKIIYTYQKHQGVSSARNKGLIKAKGKFISFLDSDDRFLKNKLLIFHDYINKNPSYKIFYSEEIWYRNGKFFSQKAHHKKPNGFIFSHSLRLYSVGLSTAVFSRDIFKRIGYFDKNLPACEDYDLLLRISSIYPIFLIPEYLTIKEGGHADQLSKKYPAMDKFRIYALEKILKSKSLSMINYQLAYQELKTKCDIYIKGAIKRGKKAEINYYKNLCKNFLIH
ncbi:MAG: glycosyltransferase [Candidatus Susulua stagnicola]|nr:glycosyltransferase [Candidatus Susulua stagnicola]